MTAEAIVWVGVSIACLALMVALRAIRLGRAPRLHDFSWTSVLVFAVIAGGIAAYVYQAVSPRHVELPPEFLAEPNLTPPVSRD